uniref:YTH domain-containing family protein n=1 Tax=Piliocolobus tephrosceles TaxID=591936 RepID=A0A8C9GRW7_9PRIM
MNTTTSTTSFGEDVEKLNKVNNNNVNSNFFFNNSNNTDNNWVDQKAVETHNHSNNSSNNYLDSYNNNNIGVDDNNLNNHNNFKNIRNIHKLPFNTNTTTTTTNNNNSNNMRVNNNNNSYNLCRTNEQLDNNPNTTINIPGIYDLDNNPITESKKIKVFVLKCNKICHLYLSILYGVWATGKNNTKKFVNLFKEKYTILFLFSVNESGGFQGYAQMITPPIKKLHENLWGPITKRLGGNFRVKWIKLAKIDFDIFKNITNPYNENLPLKKSRDGTEIPIHIASIICNKIYVLENEDFLVGTIYEYKRRINHVLYFSNLHKKKMLNTNTMWDTLISELNNSSDCKQITFIDGTEQSIS